MLKVIQGDTVNLTVTVEEGADLIQELYISCKYLDVCQPLTKIDDTHYMVTFDTDFTCECKVCITSYDITAKLKDNQVNTVVYNGQIQVLKKVNTIDGN